MVSRYTVRECTWQVDPYKHQRVRQKVKSCRSGVEKESGRYIAGVDVLYENVLV